MLSPATLDLLDAYWSRFLGLPDGQLRPTAPRVVVHAELGGYAGMYAQSFGAAPVVSLPAWAVRRYGRAAAEAAGAGLVDDDRWRGVFGDLLERVIGPAEIRYADAGTLRPAPREARVRLLDAADAPALERLRRACSETEWEHGGRELGAGLIAGVFAEDELAAVAGYEVWDGTIAHIGIVTHPAHRGRGLGASAVHHVARAALRSGLVPQYRALASNTPSLRIAARLGFVPYAESLAVRLRVPATHESA
jgi:RimJ/RimL family protein N-acetyltransferase